MKSFHDGKVILHAGDCMEVLRTMPADSIDAVVTDPPYHLTSIVKRFGAENAKPALSSIQRRFAKNGAALSLKDGEPTPDQYGRLSKGFMGKVWDGGDIAFRPELWAEVLRVLKPGGHMVCFGGTRTYHRMVCAIEDAGFEVRDQLAWVYGSGFPKSHDVSKGLDGVLGKQAKGFKYKGGDLPTNGGSKFRSDHPEYKAYEPATTAARQWQGWGTALKPAWEPICLARKPLSESTVAANVLRWGTGALNIDGCRIPGTLEGDPNRFAKTDGGWAVKKFNTEPIVRTEGRWPANLCHDGSPEVMAGFPETGISNGGGMKDLRKGKLFLGETNPNVTDACGFGDSGSAARFFYTAKADADDRLNSKHPTVKPVDLMQWLVRLVCPKGLTVLDPFAGTGTTGAAAFIEGRRCVLIEREAEYLADIERRMGLLLSGQDERARKLATPDPHDTLPLFAVMP